MKNWIVHGLFRLAHWIDPPKPKEPQPTVKVLVKFFDDYGMREHEWDRSALPARMRVPYANGHGGFDRPLFHLEKATYRIVKTK